MKRKESAPRSRVTRLQAQTRAIRTVNGVLLCVCGAALGSVVAVTALPQREQLAEKERELERIRDREKDIVAEKKDREAMLEALESDREYLEIHARDRLNLHEPGETIYRMKREE